MNENIEQNIPPIFIFGVFVAIFVLGNFLQRFFRRRNLIQQGQLSADGKSNLTVEQRVSANKDWASGEIKSQGVSAVVILWVVALVWNLCFGAPFLRALSDPNIKTGQQVVLGIFTLLGIVPIGFAIRFTIRHFRFGSSLCCIYGKAGVLGKTMKGVVKTRNDIKAIGDYVIQLQCLETYSTGTGKNRTTHTKSHLHQKHTVPSAGQISSKGIAFSFDLPTYPPETGYQLARGTITWQLKMDVPVEGVDYSAVFVIPVYNIG